MTKFRLSYKLPSPIPSTCQGKGGIILPPPPPPPPPTLHSKLITFSQSYNSGSGDNWYNLANIFIADGNNTTCPLYDLSSSRWLFCCGGTRDIPSDAIAHGIIVSLMKQCQPDSQIQDVYIQLFYNYSPIGNPKYEYTAWTSSPVIHHYGSDSDLWFSGVDRAKFIDPLFGIGIKVVGLLAEDTAIAKCDIAYMTLYYMSSL